MLGHMRDSTSSNSRGSIGRRSRLKMVKRIDALFAIERGINGRAAQERQRGKRSRPLVIALEAWLREQRARLSGQSKTGKAIA